MLQSLVEECVAGARFSGVNTTSAGWVVSQWVKKQGGPFLVVAPDMKSAEQLHDAVSYWLGEGVYLFPDMPLTPYDLTEVPLTIRAGMVRGWDGFNSGEFRLGIMTPAMFLYPPVSPASMTVRKGDREIREEIVKFALLYGYRRVDLCEDWGDIAVRGALMDLFPPGADHPFRLEWDGEEMIRIRSFSITDQRTRHSLEQVRLTGFDLLEHEETNELLQMLKKRVTGLGGDRLVEMAEETGHLGALTLFFPLAAATSIEGPKVLAFDPDGVRGRMEEIRKNLEQEAVENKDSGFLDVSPVEIFPLVKSDPHFYGELELFQRKGNSVRVPHEGTGMVRGNLQTFGEELDRLQQKRYSIHVVVKSDYHGKILSRFIQERDGPEVMLEPGLLREAWIIPEEKLAWIPDMIILEGPAIPARERKIDPGQRILFNQALPGDPIVHLEHGVGRFKGLSMIDGSEFVHLRYADGELYVPMDNMGLLTSYVGAEGSVAPLHSLGGKLWRNQKKRAQKVAARIVKELADVYAARRIATGIRFSEDDELQRMLESGFPHELTEDQKQTLLDVKSDMQSERPMDRLICGDVGFGKTEIALRAAFKAVGSGFQVVVLAPTTVLAYQHHQTFSERFAPYPVKVAWLSRFLSPAKQKAIIHDVKEGKVDVLIGTHRLLSRDVEFHDLGLLIMDEEQRFGVRQKEKLRGLKKNVDVLAMSATPIPRTLHMSLMQIRDLSVISTPPRGRRSVETCVTPFNPSLVRDAVLHEVKRGGQVFFLHNRVTEIPRMLRYLDDLLPDVRKVFTHGQMGEKELEANLLEFVKGDAQLLLTTTIIENGMDIPGANTMIINNAHTFGLSQLYQLRGRVGRSVWQAYCYLMVPAIHQLGEKAKDRLVALEEFSRLGSGFKIAARDLDIRGSGNLLGIEQHGHAGAVGYELFCRMVEKSIREMKGEKVEEVPPVKLSLGVPLRIPKEYISDEAERLAMYRKLLKGDIRSVREECLDRFGAIPPEVKTVFEVFRLRHRCEQLRITHVEFQENGIMIRFHPTTTINVKNIIGLAQSVHGSHFSPSGELTLPAKGKGKELIPVLMKVLRGIGVEVK